jgi:hypothetical protein
LFTVREHLDMQAGRDECGLAGPSHDEIDRGIKVKAVEPTTEAAA